MLLCDVGLVGERLGRVLVHPSPLVDCVCLFGNLLRHSQTVEKVVRGARIEQKCHRGVVAADSHELCRYLARALQGGVRLGVGCIGLTLKGLRSGDSLLELSISRPECSLGLGFACRSGGFSLQSGEEFLNFGNPRLRGGLVVAGSGDIVPARVLRGMSPHGGHQRDADRNRYRDDRNEYPSCDAACLGRATPIDSV